MRIRYDPESDILLITLRGEPPVDADEQPGGIILSYGEDGEPVSIEVLDASSRGLVGQGVLDIVLGSGDDAAPVGPR